jgi:hypothetical protein
MAFADSAHSATMLKWQVMFLKLLVKYLVIFIQNMMCSVQRLSTGCEHGRLDSKKTVPTYIGSYYLKHLHGAQYVTRHIKIE